MELSSSATSWEQSPASLRQNGSTVFQVHAQKSSKTKQVTLQLTSGPAALNDDPLPWHQPINQSVETPPCDSWVLPEKWREYPTDISKQILSSLCSSSKEAAPRKGRSSEQAQGLALLGYFYKLGTNWGGSF